MLQHELQPSFTVLALEGADCGIICLPVSSLAERAPSSIISAGHFMVRLYSFHGSGHASQQAAEQDCALWNILCEIEAQPMDRIYGPSSNSVSERT